MQVGCPKSAMNGRGWILSGQCSKPSIKIHYFSHLFARVDRCSKHVHIPVMAKRTRPGPVERVILELIEHNRQRRGRRYGERRYQAVSLWESWINYELKHRKKPAPARSGRAATRAAMPPVRRQASGLRPQARRVGYAVAVQH